MFVREVVNQAEIFELAANDFNNAYASIRRSHQESDGQWAGLFMALQTMLGAAAMLSKLLWPNTNKTDHEGNPLDEEALRMRTIRLSRGKQLRSALGVKSIPALESRKVRNAIEHFDEELDTFFDSPHRFWILDHNIGPVDQVAVVSGDGQIVSKTLRLFDPDTGNAHVAGRSVRVQELADAVSRLGREAGRWMETSQEPFVRD